MGQRRVKISGRLVEGQSTSLGPYQPTAEMTQSTHHTMEQMSPWFWKEESSTYRWEQRGEHHPGPERWGRNPSQIELPFKNHHGVRTNRDILFLPFLPVITPTSLPQPSCWHTLLSREGLETWPSGAGWGKTALLIQCLETSSFPTSHFQEQVHCSASQTVITRENLS